MPNGSINATFFSTTNGGGPFCFWLFRGILFAAHFLNLILEVHIDYPEQSC